jgi:TPR repeat protein
VAVVIVVFLQIKVDGSHLNLIRAHDDHPDRDGRRRCAASRFGLRPTRLAAQRKTYTTSWDINSLWSWTDEDRRADGFSAALSSRRENGEVAASFYFGIRSWKQCRGLEQLFKGQTVPEVADCWAKSLDSLKLASAAQVPAATFNIARMYENGFGVIASKYVAADWYVKSAEQYKNRGSRDEALTSLEAALAAVQDHPAALRLRKIMLR